MSLYDELGVPRDASAEEIKRAYRKASKRAHPDGGGSEAKFNALTKAYGVLKDSARRARYDATGDATEAAPDLAQAEIYSTVASHLDAVMQDHIANGGGFLTTADMVKTVITKLRASRRGMDQGQAAQRNALGYWKRIKGRFSRKGGVSVLGSIVDARIEDLDRAITEGDRRKGVVDKAIALLEDESFRFDAPSNPVVQMYQPFPMMFGR